MSTTNKPAVDEAAVVADDLTARLRDLLASEAPEVDDAARAEHAGVLRRALSDGAQVLKPGDLLATTEASEVIGVSRVTLSRWHTQGYAPPAFLSVGGYLVWTRSVIEAFGVEHRSIADAAGRRPPADRA